MKTHLFHGGIEQQILKKVQVFRYHDNYRSLQTDNVCTEGELCKTSLRYYLRNLGELLYTKKHYDAFRRDYAGQSTQEADRES